MKKKFNSYPKHFATLAIALTLFAAWSCDLFDDDVVPEQSQVTVGKTDVYALTNSTAIIDLKSMIKSYSQVELTVTTQPAHGNLQKIREAVFQYTPDANFRNGKDHFRIRLSSNGKTVTEDSVIIHVGQDTTQFPCGLYALMDSVNIPANHPGVTVIDALDNDFTCGFEPADLKLTLFSNAQHGVAAVDNNFKLASYQQDANFSGHDYFLYQITSISDTSYSSIGVVSIFVDNGGVCEINLEDDGFFQEVTSATSPVFNINVTFNDELCDYNPAVDLLIINGAPGRGTAVLSAGGDIQYTVSEPFTESFNDSLTYKYCKNDVCYTATLRLTFAVIGCIAETQPDTLVLPGSAVQSFIDVLRNDELCNAGLGSLEVASNPKHGTATINDFGVIYTADSPTSATDSLTYRVCNTGGACLTGRVHIRRQ